MMLKIIFLLFFYVPLASSFIYDAFYHTDIYNCYMFKSVSHFLHGFQISCYAYKGIPILKTVEYCSTFFRILYGFIFYMYNANSFGIYYVCQVLIFIFFCSIYLNELFFFFYYFFELTHLCKSPVIMTEFELEQFCILPLPKFSSLLFFISLS